MLLTSARSVLVVVDVQERLMPAVGDADRVLRNLDVLLRAAAELSVPVLASEQYPRGLGATLPAVRAALPPDSVIEKTSFSCAGEPAFLDRLGALGAERNQIVLAGVEAHVCVLQTALSLVERGHEVFLVADAVSSRVSSSVELGLARMRANGVEIVTTEMVLFEWLERAGTPAFKALSALIK